MNTEWNNDGQPNIDEGLGSREEMEIHDDVEDEYVEAQECEVDNNNQQYTELDDLIEDNNMDDIENVDPNASSNNIDGVQTYFIDVEDAEDDEGEDEDEYNTTLAGWCNKNNINYLQEHMNIDKDTLDDIVADNNVNEDF